MLDHDYSIVGLLAAAILALWGLHIKDYIGVGKRLDKCQEDKLETVKENGFMRGQIDILKTYMMSSAQTSPTTTIIREPVLTPTSTEVTRA